MTATAPLIGEMLWQEGLASHHGYPITFGVLSGLMILIGLVLFIQVVRSYAPEEA